MGEAILQLQKIEKSFGETKVLKGIDLTVEQGEFITFLGASGCGKTTTLRIIAGLEELDKGTVILNGKDVSNEEPHKRDVNTVFQNYALFPHMNVYRNIAYGLKIKKDTKTEIRRKVAQALKLVQLEGYEERMPSELSGGQKQRVAIARAVVNNPSVLLLDEPLGALDLQLRRQMQTELKQIQKKLGMTFIYITHDQEEAINMSDRIAVMRDGEFIQIGSPDDIYNRPKTCYVAKFVGNSNVIEGELKEIQGEFAIVEISGNEVLVPCETGKKPGQHVHIAVRGQVIEIMDNDSEIGIPAKITEENFAAGMMHMKLQMQNGTEITASHYGIDMEYEEGSMVKISWKPENSLFVECDNNNER